MKKIFFLVIALPFAAMVSHAQPSNYKVAFDLTSKDSVVHHMVIRWLNEILSSDPQAQLEVVFYGQGLDMITKDRSTVATEVIRLAKDKKVAFLVCAAAMRNNNIVADQLLPGVGTVPDGIYELIKKQHEGWGYIKASR